MEIFLTTEEFDRKEIFRFPFIESRNVDITLPITTETFENSHGKTLTLIGEEGLRTIAISSFFPHKRYRWLPFFTTTAPECLKYIKKHRKDILRITVITLQETISFLCYIKDFNYSQRANRDIEYSITFEEYIKLE